MDSGFLYADALSGVGAGAGSGIQYSKDADGNIYGSIPAVTVSSKKSGSKFDWNSLIGNVSNALPGVLTGIAAIKGNYNPQPVPYETPYTGGTNQSLLIIAALALFLIILVFLLRRK